MHVYLFVSISCSDFLSVFSFFTYIYILLLSKEVGKQYIRITNDFYVMELTMMKFGTSHHNTIAIYHKNSQKNKTGW